MSKNLVGTSLFGGHNIVPFDWNKWKKMVATGPLFLILSGGSAYVLRCMTEIITTFILTILAYHMHE